MKYSSPNAAIYVPIIILVVIIGFIALVGVVAVRNKSTPVVFSTKSMLSTLWNRYKENYVEPETYRALDRSRGNITTSEGQSYTMLRAVWMDDHPTFDASWKWTQENLKLKQNNLFAWLYGKKSNGSYGILTEQNGQNTASDADIDIALSLAFAYARWGDQKYLESSKAIIGDIWANEVVIVNGKPYLAANNIEKNFADDVLSNPSYYAPYAFRVFKEIDPEHDWNSLIDTSYEVLAQSISAGFGGGSAKLPPNWIGISKANGNVRATGSELLDQNFGFDALRIPWRIYLDWLWYEDPRSKSILDSMAFLKKEWESNGKIYAVYSHSGQVVVKDETAAMYGGTIGYFLTSEPELAKEIYDKKLVSLYSPDTNSWETPLTYYDDNWAWFGIALYNNELPNLWASLKR